MVFGIPTGSCIAIGAWGLQTLSVFAGNSRLFGLLKEGSGWYTNVEMSRRHASLVTPAKWAFAIWGIIYVWEFAALSYVALSGASIDGLTLKFWVAANVCQMIWAPLFATEHLAMSAIALAGIAASLVSLGFTMTGFGYFAPVVWLHGGWTVAASLANLNLCLVTRSAAAQLAAAHATAAVAVALGLGVVAAAVTPAPTLAPLALAAAITWALHAIRSELAAPDLIKTSEAYAEVGETARCGLELFVRGCAICLGTAIASIGLAQVGRIVLLSD